MDDTTSKALPAGMGVKPMLKDKLTHYECNICGSQEEVYDAPEEESDVGICTTCWYEFLTGGERRAIYERLKRRRQSADTEGSE